MAVPLRTIRRAVSYAGDSEYRYAMPYANDGVAEFSTWLRPGQAGLPRVTKVVGAGDLDGVAWHAAVGVGPWGYCASFINGSSCFATTTVPRLLSAGQIFHSLACGPLSDGSGKNDGASAGVMAVPPDVKDVVLRFARQQQAPAGRDSRRRNTRARLRDRGPARCHSDAGVRGARAAGALGIRDGLGMSAGHRCGWLAG